MCKSEMESATTSVLYTSAGEREKRESIKYKGLRLEQVRVDLSTHHRVQGSSLMCAHWSHACEGEEE